MAQHQNVKYRKECSVRYEKGQKELTRDRIVKNASRRFRKEGIDAVGLASLMSDVGLTHGGFYNHFKSKEDLVAAALSSALMDSFKKNEQRASKEKGGELEGFVRAYLHPSHRDNPDKGCAISAAAAEIARHPESTRKVIDERIEALLTLIERNLPAGFTEGQKRQTAVAVFSVMIGALQLARITIDKEKSDQILQSGISAALAIVGKVG